MFPVPGNFGGLWYISWQLYALEIIQMTLESAWIYEIHQFQLTFVFIYCKEVKIILQLLISWQLCPFWSLKLQLRVT